jgi:hypothetical protein
MTSAQHATEARNQCIILMAMSCSSLFELMSARHNEDVGALEKEGKLICSDLITLSRLVTQIPPSSASFSILFPASLR